MASLKDLVKQALEKKQAEQHPDTGNAASNVAGNAAPKQKVTSNKPAKKSAGRGR